MTLWHWLMAGVISVSLHALAFLPMLSWDQSDGAQAIGAGGLEVGLGLAGDYLPAPETARMAGTEPVDVKPEPVPATTPELASKPHPVAPSVPVEAIPELVVVERPALDDSVVTTSKPAIPARQALVSPREQPDTSTPISSEPQPPTQTAKRQATGQSRQRSSGGKVGDVQGYFAQLSAWIDANKTYPPELKKRKKEGTVTVKFSIDRAGQLLVSSIKRSSGHPQLDEAALATLARANPFPPIPDFLDRHRLSVEVPIDYTLIKNQFGD